MNVETTINAIERAESGKGPAKRLRREGMIPAVFYGAGLEARTLTVNAKEVTKELFGPSGSRSLFQLNIDVDGKAEEKLVMLKDYQIDPIKRSVMHVDFFEVDYNKPLQIEVPLVLNGKPDGVEKGGLLQQIRRELLISALPKDLPDKIEVDVTSMDMGESLHVGEVAVPEGVELVFDVNFTVATVIAPKGAKTTDEEEEEGEAEGAEPAAEA